LTRWEYKIVDSHDAPSGGMFKDKSRAQIEGYLADLGQDGWEIISLSIEEKEGRFSLLGLAKRELVVQDAG
jgi:hypothetical protein